MERYKNLYIKTAHLTLDNIKIIPNMDLLPIFLDQDLRSMDIVRGFNHTAIHIPELGPSSKAFSKFYGGYITETQFKGDYFMELLNKDFIGIFKRIDFLVKLSNAVGVVLMDGISYPRYVDYLADFLNLSEFFKTPIEELIIPEDMEDLGYGGTC